MELVIIIFMGLFCILATRCAYYNGVNDGYKSHLEPWNPCYKKAKDLLQENCIWREKEN